MSLLSQVCYYCEKPDPDLQCLLECRRSFHQNCLRLRAWEEIEDNMIYCENCLLRIHRCSFCGIHSQIHTSFYKCSVPQCNRFYHDECTRKLRNVYGNQKLTTHQGKFKCPAHYSLISDKQIDPAQAEDVITCVRCYVAYYKAEGNYELIRLSSNQIVCQRHERCEDGNQNWPRYKNEGSFISCVKNQSDQITIRYKLTQFLEEAPHFIEKQYYEKLNTRGVKPLGQMTQEEKVKKNQYEWCKMKQFECLSFNESYILKSRELMKLVASNKDFIEKNIKIAKKEEPVENEETEVTDSLYVRKTPTTMDLFVYSSSQYLLLKRDKKQLEKLAHSYKQGMSIEPRKMIKTSRRLAFKERRKN